LVSRKRVERKKDPRRLRTYSFVATLAIITIIVGASYYQTLPSVEHIPDAFAFNFQEWMAYVPANAEYVGYVNYGEAYSLTGNLSLFGERVLIELPQLGFEIIPLDLTYEVAIQLPEPTFSGSALLLQVSPGKQTSLSHELESANLTKIPPPRIYDGFALYELLMQELGDTNPSPGYMAVVNHHIILSNDKNTGLQNVEAILDQIRSDRSSLFDDVTVRRSVYASGVTDQSCIALFVGRFPTQLNDSEMATKSIIGEGGSIQVSRALLFSSPDVALARWDDAHRVYENAASYQVLDSWLVVTYDYPPTRIQAEIIGI
jgi:hypothetical protein